MLLPLQGVLLLSIRTPKALPWAMSLLGFQPALFGLSHPLEQLAVLILKKSFVKLLAKEGVTKVSYMS